MTIKQQGKIMNEKTVDIHGIYINNFNVGTNYLIMFQLNYNTIKIDCNFWKF